MISVRLACSQDRSETPKIAKNEQRYFHGFHLIFCGFPYKFTDIILWILAGGTDRHTRLIGASAQYLYWTYVTS